MNKKLLEILACPLCKTRLLYDTPNRRFICRIDKLAYPIREDIPVMLVEEAQKLSDEEIKKY